LKAEAGVNTGQLLEGTIVGLRRRAGLAALSLSVSVLALTAGPAWAQTAPADEPAQAEDSATVTEVVVTARRREESIQDVPVAITAITAEAFENLQTRDIADISGLAPVGGHRPGRAGYLAAPRSRSAASAPSRSRRPTSRASA
jgi:outer membrane receptor protein involved in Fe transport